MKPLELMPNPEREVDPKSIGVVTTTFYKRWYPGAIRQYSAGQLQNNEVNQERIDKTRGDLALRMILRANKRGFRVVVIDGGSPATFIEGLKGTEVIVSAETEKGMSPSRQQGFREISGLFGVKVICWSEPEKVSITADCLPQAIIPILKGEADIVVPKRNEGLFKETYPDYQVRFEQDSNRIWNAILRKYGLRSAEEPDLDVWFGPKFFRNDPALLSLFTDKYLFVKDPNLNFHKIIKPELWPNAIFFPVIAVLHKGFKVASIEVPYRHPPEQTAIEQDSDEFRRKREIQQRNIILSSEFFVRSLLGLKSNTGRINKVS